MFGNLNWTNVVILLLLALFIFGDKLPAIIADGLRLLRNLRRMAQTATTDLNRELGTDLQLEDLHPKTFVRKHLLSEADQEALLKPLRGVSDDVLRQARGVENDLREVGRRTERVTGELKQATERGTPGQAGVVAGPAAAVQPPAANAHLPSYDDIT